MKEEEGEIIERVHPPLKIFRNQLKGWEIPRKTKRFDVFMGKVKSSCYVLLELLSEYFNILRIILV